MTESLDRFGRFLPELKRRNVYKVAVTYAAVAFVTLQAARLIFPATTLEGLYDKLVVLAFVGFPIALVIAWAFELTPEGVQRTAKADDAEEASGSEAMSPEKRRAQSRLAMKALVGLGLVGAVMAGAWYLVGGGGESPEVTEGTVAVLPFQVSGSGAEEWRDGMVSLLTPGLDGAAGLRAIPDRTVFAAWRENGQQDGGSSTEEAVGVAREVGARYAVVGSAVALGSGLRLTASVRDTRAGGRLGQVEVRGSPENVMALADSLGRRVLEVLLQERGEAVPSVNLASLTTRSLPALKAYLEGERHYRRGEFDVAVELYREAVGGDSTFALAHWRLSRALAWGTRSRARSGPSLRKAFQLSSRLPRRERRLVRVDHLFHARNEPLAARDTLRRLAEVYPDEPQAWYLLGEVLYHSGVPKGFPEAERAFRRAVQLDSGFAPFHNHLVDLAVVFHHDSALAEKRLSEHPGLASDAPVSRTAISLAFGTAALRDAAIAGLSSLQVHELESVRRMLEHPHSWRAREAVLEEFRSRGLPDRSERAARDLLEGSLHQGLFREAATYMEQAELTEDDRVCVLAQTLVAGVPIPDSLLPGDLGSAGEQPTGRALFCRGLYALERGGRDLLDSIRSRLRASWEESWIAPALQVLDAVEASKSGDAKRALRLAAGNRLVVRADLQLWLADHYRELGRLREAEGWYLGAWRRPLAHERLGRLYEEMGKPEKAAAAYRRFIAAWEDADEELQPRVEEARERVRQLTGSEDEPDD